MQQTPICPDFKHTERNFPKMQTESLYYSQPQTYEPADHQSHFVCKICGVSFKGHIEDKVLISID